MREVVGAITINEAIEWTSTQLRKAHQKEDVDISPVLKAKAEDGNRPGNGISSESEVTKSYMVQLDSLLVVNGLLKRKWESAPQRRTRGEMRQFNSGNPFEQIGIDITSPFHITNSGNRVMLVVLDYFTKWPEVYALPNQEAATVAKC